VAISIDDLGRKITIEISPLADVNLAKATQLLRALRNTPAVPSQGEVLCWVLESFPVDEMFSEIFGIQYPGVPNEQENPSARAKRASKKPVSRVPPDSVT
jgi:hypothetical protein